MRNLDIADSRAKLKVTPASRSSRGSCWSSNASFGELPAGGYDQITDNPLAQGGDDDALDRAAMESGTD